MSTRRHLPIVRDVAPAPAGAAPAATEPAAEPPPWHWIPLGTTVSLVGFALLAQGAAALSVRLLGRVYPLGATAAQVEHIRAAHPAAAVFQHVVVGLSMVERNQRRHGLFLLAQYSVV